MVLVTFAETKVTRVRGRRPVNTALRLDLCTDTLIGENLKQDGMIDAAVDNSRGRHATINRIKCTVNFR